MYASMLPTVYELRIHDGGVLLDCAAMLLKEVE